MIFDYNSTRPKLILAEYGRNVQNMVDYICTVPDRAERNRLAQVVIDMMGVLNPHLRDVSDFKHKLWDHLYIISDFKIDAVLGSKFSNSLWKKSNAVFNS